MALNAALKQLIETKLAHTHEPQWTLPITEVRQAFCNLWTPEINASHKRPVMVYMHGGGFAGGSGHDLFS